VQQKDRLASAVRYKLTFMNHRTVLRGVGTIFMLCAAFASPGETFTVLKDFELSDGAQPWHMSMVQGLDGNLYGTTLGGGTYYSGTVFKITPAGTLTTLYNFCSQAGCPDGSGPEAGLMLATDGSFYGTTGSGGANTAGTIFRITADGRLTTVHAFTGVDGSGFYATLVQGTDGNFYGTSPGGSGGGYGTIFKITPAGTLTTLYTFCAQTNCTDGYVPVAGLALGTDGNFYGTTIQGGANNYGTVYKFTPSGALTTLYSFCSQTNCADGEEPFAALVQGGDRDFYGTTIAGGSGGGGTVFKITPEGTLTTLYSLCLLCRAGGPTSARLAQGTDGNLYGTTEGSARYAVYPYGTIFRITPDGKIAFLHSFNFTDGATPTGGLVQGTDGKFYGATTYGGSPANGAYGTVFSLSLDLGPFVTTLPTGGDVGEAVKVLGTDLTGATGVSFNGIAAAFTVVSATEISAIVPTGATTGKLQVTTPTRTLLSNVAFRVR
jgi:uncharacterized repeat protein (TIGR03803 family)